MLEHEAEEGDERAKVALELASDSSTFLAATQIGMTMLGFMILTLGAWLFVLKSGKISMKGF